MNGSLELRLIGGRRPCRRDPGEQNLAGTLSDWHRPDLAEVGTEDVNDAVVRAPRLQSVDPAPGVYRHAAVAHDGDPVPFASDHGPFSGIELHQPFGPG